jgi:hypothetical protein
MPRFEPDLQTVGTPGRGDTIDLPPRAVHGDAALEASDGLQHQAAAVGFVVAAVVGDPDVGTGLRTDAGGQEELEAGRQNADDSRAGAAGAEHLAAKDGRIGAVTPLKVIVAEDRDGALRRREGRRRLAAWPAIGVREIAAERDVCAQHGEKVGGDEALADALGAAVLARNHGAEDHHGGHVFELGVGSVAQIEEAGVGKGSVRQDQPIRILVRKRPQKHGIGHAENSGAGADAESDSRHRGDRERGTLSQDARGVGEVFDEIVEKVQAAHVAASSRRTTWVMALDRRSQSAACFSSCPRPGRVSE